MTTLEGRESIPSDIPSPCCDANAARKERRDAAEHRLRILSVARDLFASQGVNATSMAEIARAAQVGQGTLYRRYAHKGELCMALIDDNLRRFQEDMQARLVSVGGGAALEQLEFLLLRLAAFNEENAPLLGAIGDAACGERRTAVYQSPLYTWLRAMVVLLLQRALERSETAPLDVEASADAVLAPLAIDLYLYQRHALGFTPDRITRSLHRLIFDGLRK